MQGNPLPAGASPQGDGGRLALAPDAITACRRSRVRPPACSRVGAPPRTRGTCRPAAQATDSSTGGGCTHRSTRTDVTAASIGTTALTRTPTCASGRASSSATTKSNSTSPSGQIELRQSPVRKHFLADHDLDERDPALPAPVPPLPDVTCPTSSELDAIATRKESPVRPRHDGARGSPRSRLPHPPAFPRYRRHHREPVGVT